ncbi:Cilia- and flagella-associated protein 74 [Liparis tanakae]|uniref:Cilia-and flagella-associated protein 74 n=1 Tax=Liparis tanakae TaxID=230148 RepID=A0A4Z2F099_9TELE|nr:Cilia- and flagella-associated protein 74 [Liparis tanakae]
MPTTNYAMALLMPRPLLLSTSICLMDHGVLRVLPCSSPASLAGRPLAACGSAVGRRAVKLLGVLINQDLEGEVQFASALGPFSVPVRCSMKRCDLEVDSQRVDFGSHVVGQTISWTITLTNKGALATVFSLDTATHLSPETSRAQTTPEVSAHTCQEEGSQNTTSEDRSSSVSMGTGELQPKQESQEPCEASQQAPPGEAVMHRVFTGMPVLPTVPDVVPFLPLFTSLYYIQVYFIQPNITNYEFASVGFTICTHT